jgi:hypothetical protein
VDLEQAKSVFGSKNAKLLTEIEKAHPKQMDDFGDEENTPPLREILRGFFEGKVSEELGFCNWVAFGLICEHVGERLNTKDDVGFIDGLKFQTPLAKPRHLLPLGDSEAHGQLSVVSYLERVEFDDHLARAKNHKPGFFRKFDLKQWSAFCGYMELAKSRNRDLFTFTF